MFEGFTHTEIETSGARIVTVYGGKGAPLLLMHDNPFSHLSWHKFAPRLAEQFTVVATDLRGYGDSEKPPGGADHANYSFRAMAADQTEVMAALGHERFYAAGHDRGARVLHRMWIWVSVAAEYRADHGGVALALRIGAQLLDARSAPRDFGGAFAFIGESGQDQSLDPVGRLLREKRRRGWRRRTRRTCEPWHGR